LAEARQALLFGPADEMGSYHQLLGLPDDHSCLGAPILIRDQLLGVLTVDSQEPGQYDDQDAALVAALAGLAASALENAHLYSVGQEEAWISTALLEVAEATTLSEGIDEVLETVVRITPLLIGVDRCAVLLWDPQQDGCRVAAAYQLEGSEDNLPVGQVIRPGEWQLLDQLWESGAPVVDEFGGMPGAPSTQDVETTLLALPLRAQGELNGTMVIGFTGQVSFSGHRLKLIAGIANQAALAIESAQLAAAQEEEAWVSQALLQVAGAVANLSDLEEVLEVVVRMTPLLVGVDVCLIYLWDALRQVFVPGTAFGLRRERLDVFYSMPIPVGEWPEMNFGDAEDDERELDDDADLGLPAPIADALAVRHPLALPLLVWGDVMGALVVDNLNGSAYLSDQRFNILSGVVQQTATAIQNSRLADESVQRQRMEQELDLARQIQASFLPGQVPQVSGWDLAAHWQGARHVSGDFYDFIPLPDFGAADDCWGLVIADVADKGVPAALFTALSRTLVRTVARSGQEPARALALANDLILADSRSDLFVTLFYAILDPEQGTLTYANGGHNLPLHFNGRSGQVTELAAEGMALGVVRGIELEQKTVQLSQGDLVLFYTDGVTDALNDDMQEFGLERLKRVVEAHRDESARAVVRAIDQAVSDFVGHTPQFDDLTLVVLKQQEDRVDD
jgi:serine phosphatase RsbU (regulator of sigma subunit)